MEEDRSKSDNGGCFLIFVVLFIVELLFDRLILGKELFQEGMKMAPLVYGGIFAAGLLIWAIYDIFWGGRQKNDSKDEVNGQDQGEQ